MRRRHDSTSSSLVDVHPNLSKRINLAARDKERAQVTQLAKKEKCQTKKLTAKSMSGADMAQPIGRNEEAIRKWIHSDEKTHEVG